MTILIGLNVTRDLHESEMHPLFENDSFAIAAVFEKPIIDLQHTLSF